MTQEQEDLLLQDLCARLPYGVILNCCNIVSETLTLLGYNGLVNNDYDIDEVKPYLFPLSSMTKEQNLEYLSTCRGGNAYHPTSNTFDWFDKNHFDYRGLIPMGLAIDATGLNIY
jgi:hypothetical protein